MPALVVTFTAYLAAVVLPNALFTWLGIIDLAPGPLTLPAPAAVLGVGVALVARDALSEAARAALGRRAGIGLVVAAILAGTAVSATLDAALAAASGAAFLLAELLDLTIFEALRRRGWTVAALASSYASALLDSLVFLSLAFGSLAFLPGQYVGKVAAVTAVVALAHVTRRALSARTWTPTAARA